MAGLKFRILLDSIEDKEIFRDILISDDLNFEHFFYNTILDAFGLPNDQMASFSLVMKTGIKERKSL